MGAGVKKMELRKITKDDLSYWINWIDGRYSESTAGLGFYLESRHDKNPMLKQCKFVPPGFDYLFTYEKGLMCECAKFYWLYDYGKIHITKEELLEKLWGIITEVYQ